MPVHRLQTAEWKNTAGSSSNPADTGDPGKPGRQLLVHGVGPGHGLSPGLHE